MGYPIIGLTSYQGKNEQGFPIIALLKAYVNAIVLAGRIPLLIPSSLPEKVLKTVFKRTDGILFTGGGDIAEDRFGGEPHRQISNVDHERDSIEISILDGLIRDKKPFLGICRGLQVINVGLGGTLYTHIDDQMTYALKHDYHSGFPRAYLAHEVKIEKASYLGDILDTNILSVNSLHHQGIKDLSELLRPVAFAPDGLVEAVELPGHPFGMAVQWHPECLFDQPASQRLFQGFVQAAGNYQ
jgi:putative glutamine amidotransferase